MSAPRAYEKPYLSIEAQIELLKSRGMIFGDEGKARHFLRRINYTRLRPYWHPFEEDPRTHRFKAGTTFERVMALYEFDRRLRWLLFAPLERLEVAFRTSWAHHLAAAHGPFGYLKPELYVNQERFGRDLDGLRSEWARAHPHDPVLHHFAASYREAFPPAWLASEVMSFGLLAKWFANLQDLEVRKSIAEDFALPVSYLARALLHLAVLRNYVAHHARLWDRVFSVYSLPALRNRPRGLKRSLEGSGPNRQRVYNTLTLLIYIDRQISPQSNLAAQIALLIDRFQPSLARMGFPPDYLCRPVWSSKGG